MIDNLFHEELDKSEDDNTWVNIFCKGSSDETAKLFAGMIKERWDEVELAHGHGFDRERSFTYISSEKIQIIGRGCDYDSIEIRLDEVAKKFPALVLLIITIWSDVAEDGYAGYYCKQYKNGQITDLDINKRFEISDFDTDEDVINARNVDLENKLIPILENWQGKE